MQEEDKRSLENVAIANVGRQDVKKKHLEENVSNLMYDLKVSCTLESTFVLHQTQSTHLSSQGYKFTIYMCWNSYIYLYLRLLDVSTFFLLLFEIKNQLSM